MPTFLTPPPLPPWLAEQMPFRRRGVVVAGRRVHFVDEGEGPAVLLVHGNPMWSYLWRKVIARLRGRGLRLIAPDLLGFGLSERLPSPDQHLLSRHVLTVQRLVEALELEDMVVVGQDMGGPIAAAVAARTGRARGAVFGNTALLAPRRPLSPKAFHRASHLPLLSEGLFRGLGFPLFALHRVQGDPSSIGPRERRAYRWPLSRPADRAGPLGLARAVPDRDGHPSLIVLDETDEWARTFEGPVALVWGKRDPILGRSLKRHAEAFADPSVVVTDAGHFLQEEVPDVLADAIADVALG